MKIIAVMSGGMDSTTMVYQLLAQGNEVMAVSFNYGQRHKLELDKARNTCNRLNIPHKVIDISFIKEFISNSSLTGDIAVPEGHYADENMKQTVVPNRNMIMAAIAIGVAVNEDFDAIALGVHSGDHAIYPDCRPEFIAALDTIARIANFKPIEVMAPFLNLDKGDIAIIGKGLDVDYEQTLTCYNGESKPCGKCGACVERKEAFGKAKFQDPLTETEPAI